MKKKKTENPAENGAAESKSRVEAIIEPEEAPTVEEPDLSKVVFKKAFQGYNIADVDEYIDSQNQYHASTCAMYDEKLSELRSEVSLLNREREALLSKIEVLQAELDKALSGETVEVQISPVKEEQPKEEKSGDSLGEDKSALTAENKELKSRIAELTSELEEQKIVNDELSERISELDKSKAEISGLRNEIAGLNQAVSEKNIKLSQLEGVEAELAGLRNDYGELDKLYKAECEKREKAEETLNEKSAQLTAGEKEQSRLRKELSDFEIRQNILHQQLKKSYDDLDELRETNRVQAYEYADKLSKEQADFAAEKINLKKQLQFHLFHIRQVGELLDEVKKEYEQAEASLKDFETE